MTETNLQLSIRLLREWRDRLNAIPGPSSRYEGAVELPRFNYESYFNHCGTTACAIGYLVQQPDIQERGLRVEPFWGVQNSMYYEGHHASQAVAHFLHIPQQEAQDVFYRAKNPTLDGVIDALERL